MKRFALLLIFGAIVGAAFAFLFLYMEFSDNSEELSPYRPVLDQSASAGK